MRGKTTRLLRKHYVKNGPFQNSFRHLKRWWSTASHVKRSHYSDRIKEMLIWEEKIKCNH